MRKVCAMLTAFIILIAGIAALGVGVAGEGWNLAEPVMTFGAVLTLCAAVQLLPLVEALT